ncbi:MULTISPECIES: SoxR reducing system RseC family protein [unclassified Uliginosibacterium]|uniref:SoxR reducing system RseC family protein n=1 Tax=unclassified Uliginosibacterium TaxID=2621521 RepID=UPI0013042487|nr:MULTISPECIES: SoxR reducing system RseC family protein [unclassified Uliginosibacterium]MDO6386788.1 SoxR reducing system RseC family protein [Uliginosibacterium sp. 31-12]
MIQRPARVIAIHADHMQVAFDPASACGSCGSKKACHGENPEHSLQLPVQAGFSAGDEILLGIESRTLTLAALLAWLMPALALLLGAMLGQALFGSDLAAILAALGGLAGGLLIARQLARRYADDQMQPCIQPCFQTPTGSTS